MEGSGAGFPEFDLSRVKVTKFEDYHYREVTDDNPWYGMGHILTISKSDNVSEEFIKEKCGIGTSTCPADEFVIFWRLRTHGESSVYCEGLPNTLGHTHKVKLTGDEFKFRIYFGETDTSTLTVFSVAQLYQDFLNNGGNIIDSSPPNKYPNPIVSNT